MDHSSVMEVCMSTDYWEILLTRNTPLVQIPLKPRQIPNYSRNVNIRIDDFRFRKLCEISAYVTHDLRYVLFDHFLYLAILGILKYVDKRIYYLIILWSNFLTFG